MRLVAEPLPRREFVSRARGKNFDVVLSGWWAGTRLELENLFHSRSALNRGNNLVSWATRESDDLITRAARAENRELAAALWQSWQAIFREEQPITVLYEEKRLLGLSGRTRAPKVSYLNPFESIPLWTIADEPRSMHER